jgi:TatA/E family protein of Tat protein translocase
MLSLGWQEMALIFIAALVLFGPKKLPELGRTIGKAITEFRRASNELKSTFDREMQTIERENESLRATTQKYLDDIHGEATETAHAALPSDSYEHSSYYDSAYYDSEAYRSSEETTAIAGDSTTATHSTVGEPAPQGAETASAAETAIVPKAAEGTVARGTSMEPPPPVAERA